jgi:hypothetical protein
MPKHLLHSQALSLADGLNGEDMNRPDLESKCKPECFRQDFLVKTTTGYTDFASMERFVNQTGIDIGKSRYCLLYVRVLVPNIHSDKIYFYFFQ